MFLDRPIEHRARCHESLRAPRLEQIAGAPYRRREFAEPIHLDSHGLRIGRQLAAYEQLDCHGVNAAEVRERIQVPFACKAGLAGKSILKSARQDVAEDFCRERVGDSPVQLRKSIELQAPTSDLLPAPLDRVRREIREPIRRQRAGHYHP